MERIESTEFSEITIKQDVQKYIYAAIYISCSLMLAVYTFLSTLSDNNRTCLYILSVFLLSSGIIFTLLRNGRKIIKSSGSCVSYGRIQLNEKSAQILELEEEIRKISSTTIHDNFRISYVISQDRRFFAFQLQKCNNVTGVEAITEPKILRNENAATISSRLRINFTE